MDAPSQCRLFATLHLLRVGRVALASAIALCALGCKSNRQIRIVVIPRTDGTAQWEPLHTGAELAAERSGISIHWHGPMREDDVEGQIKQVNQAMGEGYQGLVLAPNHALALITVVRRTVTKGIPTVIVGSRLPISPGGNLFYVVNDDREAAQIAAQRVASLLKGNGTVAILGINPDVASIMIRTRAFEEFTAEHYPGIRIVDLRMGLFNSLHEQQVAEETLRANPKLDIILSQMSATTDGALAALSALPGKYPTKVIAFDSSDSLGSSFDRKPALDCVIQQDTRAMGLQAIELLHAKLLGQPVPALVQLPPKLITRENISDPEIQKALSMDFTLGQWRWSPIQ